MKDDFFTINELARHFGVNPKTIYTRLWAKGIPAYKIGRAWRIAREDIIWLRQQICGVFCSYLSEAIES